MLTVAICDDETYMLDKLKKSVERYLIKRDVDAHITSFTSGEALLAVEGFFDIVLTDIKMPGKNGIEVAVQLRSRKRCSQIIFITSYREYAVQAFEVDAVHYLLKPVSEADLFGALDKAIQRLDDGDKKTIAIRKGSVAQVIFIRDITYCEIVDHRLYIHTASGSCECFGTLDSLQEKLDRRFFRCHKSYIVNISCVMGKDHDMAKVKGGGRVLISRRKQQEFTKLLLDFFRGEIL